ncbi:MAG TPA: CusA/CzcA family heavy metal efflux RND transporter, partial [Sunxiuqinia sp.]|nr:CusA/CzcA family heavy metal efflux RND transporter [Sunxiuqinia sp.]
MINQIISFSIKNKLIIGLFTLLLVGWGIYSLLNIPINAVPDITNNQVQVITLSENLAAQEVEQYITQPVELAMSNLPGVTDIRSVSRFGLSVVTVVFEDKMGMYKTRQLVSEQLKEAEDNIEPGLGKPRMGPISTGLGEIYQYTVEAKPGYKDKYNATKLRTIQDWIIKRQLSGVPGVVEINSVGGYLKQYEIAVDPNQLNSYNLTIADLYEAVEANNQNTGGGYIEKGSNLYYVRSRGLVGSIDDIRKTVITTRDGVPVTVGDVSTVQIGHAPRYGAATMDGQGETVIGVVMMLRGANSIDVIDAVKNRIAEIQKSLPEGVVIRPFVDRTKLIDKTTGTIEENLLIGGTIVILALVFLLGTLRAGLIVASIIPLSLLFAFGMMDALGISANLMSLGAMDFGIIVDGAVIIVEFMAVQLTGNNDYLRKLSRRKRQPELNDIAFHSASRMMNAATFGQIIILIVFIPILTLQGVEGKMFIPMALTFAFAILGAMILCLTYIPMISSLLLYGKSTGRKNIGDQFMEWLDKVVYQPVIKGALQFKSPVLVGAVILLGLAIFIFLNMGGEFIPKLQEGDFAIETHMPPGTSLPEMEQSMGKLEKILLGFPEVQKVVSRIGAAEVPTDPDGIEVDYVTIVLKPKNRWKSDLSYEELVDKMKKAISVLPGVSGEFSQPIELRFNELLS